MADVRKIITEEDPLLREKSVEVQRFGASLHKLLDDMRATMYDADGVGLAAPQVGILKQVVVIDDRQNGYIELINPRIVDCKGSIESTEFCLSVPDRGGKVTRYRAIKVNALDRNGKPFGVKCNERLAIIFQHEIDHLNGILFTDIMSEEVSREQAFDAEDAEDNPGGGLPK
jgi:peptide deformylase